LPLARWSLDGIGVRRDRPRRERHPRQAADHARDAGGGARNRRDRPGRGVPLAVCDGRLLPDHRGDLLAADGGTAAAPPPAGRQPPDCRRIAYSVGWGHEPFIWRNSATKTSGISSVLGVRSPSSCASSAAKSLQLFRSAFHSCALARSRPIAAVILANSSALTIRQ